MSILMGSLVELALTAYVLWCHLSTGASVGITSSLIVVEIKSITL